MATRRFPNTLSELPEAGYRFVRHSVCGGCGKKIETWLPPLSAAVSYDVMIDGTSLIKPHRCGRSSREVTAASARRHAAHW
jgi:hypothetical protein